MSAPLYAAELDRAELAVRIAESIVGLKRPVGMSAATVLAQLGPDEGGVFTGAADAAMAYMAERVAAAARVQ